MRALALDALLTCARTYDRQSPTLREPSLLAQVRLLLAAGEGLQSVQQDEHIEGVRILTVHASKGLEFPVVFIPNLAKGRFPGRGRGGPSIAPGILPSDEATARAADNRCLFFVAISRARDRLVLSRAERYGSGGTASPLPPSPLLTLTDAAFTLEPPLQVRWTRAAVEALRPDGAANDSTLPAGPERPTLAEVRSASDETLEVDAAALESYLACPRKYYYAHQLHLGGPAGDPAAPGTSGFPHFHRTIRRALARLHEAGPATDTDAGLQMLAEEWETTHDPHPLEALYLERARAAITTAREAFGRQERQPGNSLHGVTYQLTRPAGVVHVRIDRLDLPTAAAPHPEHPTSPSDRPRIRPDRAGNRAGDHDLAPVTAVRYRSGRPSDDHRREHRTALYQAAVEAVHGQGTVQQEYLLTGAVDDSRARASTLAARLAECDTALEGIVAQRFPAHPGEQCPECPFWLICPAG